MNNDYNEKLNNDNTENYDLDKPFVENVIKMYQLDINNYDDLEELSSLVRLSCLIYLLSNIQLKILKKYWESKSKKTLSDDEVITIAENKHPYKIYHYTHNLKLDFHWTEKATIYNNINKILTISEAFDKPLFVGKNQIELYYALLNKDINFLADYYSCIVHVGQRRMLQDMGIEQYIDTKIDDFKTDKNKELYKK